MSWAASLYRKPFRSEATSGDIGSANKSSADDDDSTSVARTSNIVPGVARGGDGQSLSITDFEVLSKIGEGGFGTVLLVRKRSTGKLYALKVLVKKNMRRSGDARRAISESAAMQEIKHPFVVTLHFAFQDSNHIYFVLEFVGGGDLYSHLERQTFPEEVKRRPTTAPSPVEGDGESGHRGPRLHRLGCRVLGGNGEDGQYASASRAPELGPESSDGGWSHTHTHTHTNTHTHTHTHTNTHTHRAVPYTHLTLPTKRIV